MATVDPETHAPAAGGFNFLGLPPEVRTMIYRLLLVADKPLSASKYEREREAEHNSGLDWASFGEYHLQPAMLRVCWQLYRESSPILNLENAFGIRIHLFQFYGMLRISFRCSSLNDGLNSFWNTSMDRFQRFEILIMQGDMTEVKYSVGMLCRSYLSKSHALQHINIYLHDSCQGECEVLEPFGVLRNLCSVNFHGAPQQFTERLRQVMLGNTPPEDLDGMYRMLKFYVTHLHGNRRDLQIALDAVRVWDVQKFKEIRSNIVSDVQGFFERTSRQLFKFDTHIEEDHQAMNVSAKDSMAMPKDGHEPQDKEIPRKD